MVELPEAGAEELDIHINLDSTAFQSSDYVSLLVDPLVFHVPHPIDAPPTAAVPLIPVMLVARLSAAPLPRCDTSSPGPKFTGESKVRWSSVIRFCTRLSCLVREVSILSRSPSLVSKLSRSPS